MKRTRLILLLAVILCLFASCAQYEVPEDPLFYEGKVFSFSASGKVGQSDCAFVCHRRESGATELVFTAPAAMAQMRFCVYSLPNETVDSTSPHGVRVYYDGMEIALSEGAMPSGIFAIAKAFSLRQAEMTACRLADGGQTQVSFSCEDGVADLCLASGTGYPTALNAQLYGVQIDFAISDFVISEG